MATKKIELLSGTYVSGQHTAGAAYSAGDLVTVNDVNGFPIVDVANGALFALITEADKVRIEKTAAAIGAGAAVYWVNATSNVATAGDILIGYALEAAADVDTHVIARFDGNAAFLKV